MTTNRQDYRKTTTAVGFATLACIVVLFLGTIIRTVSTSLNAEKTLHATHFVAQIVERFLFENNGRWPKSWVELETIHIESKAGYAWPQDRQELETRVWVDFNVDEERLASLEAARFDLIKPIGPCYEGYEQFFIPIVQEIRVTRLRHKGESSLK